MTMKQPVLSVLALLLLAAALSGCVTLPDPEASQEFGGHTVGTVGGARAMGATTGQTVVSRRPGLNGVELWLSVPETPEPAPGALLHLQVFAHPKASAPLASARVPAATVVSEHPVRVRFTPQDDPPGQEYYFQLSAEGMSVDVRGRDEDAYPQGQAWVDGEPVNADLAFRLLYDYDAAAMAGDLWDLMPRLWLALPLGALLILPGWLLLDLSGLRRQFDGGGQVAVAAGLSAALIPLLLLWTTTAGLRWSRPAVLIAAGLLVVVAAWRLVRGWTKRPGRDRGRPADAGREVDWVSRAWPWALGGVFVLSLAVRLAMVRDLAVPAWVDSVHHSLIAQLIVDGGALPSTYEPFVGVDTASYHAGFQSLVAAAHWLSGLDVAGAMLLVGQVLNALMVVAAYLLARELTGDRVLALVAALVVGLFSPMPAYYASWGRYTQLAGLLILPAALVLAWRALPPRASGGEARSGATPPGTGAGAEGTRVGGVTPPGTGAGAGEAGGQATAAGRAARRRYMVLAALALAGLVLTHYRVAAFYACFLVAYLAGRRLCRHRLWRRLAGDLLPWGIIVAGAVVLTLPWLVPAMATFWLPKLTAWIATDPATYWDFSWRYLTPAQGKYVLVLSVLGMGWALVQRRRFALVLAIWVALLFLLASLGPLGLPGAGFVDYTSVEIALFLPLSVLVGYVFSQLLAAWRAVLPARWLGPYRGLVAVLGVGLALFGALTMLPILNAKTVLFRQADEPAMAWIRENVPQDGLVLVNPMAWSAHLYAGHDGGYWISPLAGRRTLPPPALYGLDSAAGVGAINEFCVAVLKQGQDPDALWPLLQDWGVSHVYLGARGGVLSARALAESEHYAPVYSREGTWVFEVLAPVP